MARSKRETQNLINDLKAQIKKLNKDTGIGLNYRNVHSVFASIFNSGNENDINRGISTYENAIKREIAEDVLPTRTLICSNRVMAEKHEKNPIAKYSITQISEDVRKLMDLCGELFREGYRSTHKPTETDVNAVYNWEMRELKKQSYFSAANMSITAWDRNCFKDESAALNECFRKANGEINYAFKNEYDERNSMEDLIAADAYHKVSLIKEELAKHGAVWRFFNFRYVAACNEYIANANDILAKIGFNEKDHGAKAIEMLKNTVAIPHDSDIKKVNAARDKKLADIAKAQAKGKDKNKDNGKQKDAKDKKSEQMEITDKVREFGNRMLDPDFTPTQAKIYEEFKMMNALTRLLKDNSAFNDDKFGKLVFNASREKIVAMLNVVRNNGFGREELSGKLGEIQNRLWSDLTAGYEPPTIQDYEKAAAADKKPVAVDVNSNDKVKNADEKKNEVNGVEIEQPNQDEGFNLFEGEAEPQGIENQNNVEREKIDPSGFSLFDVDDSEKAPGVEEHIEEGAAQKGI